MHYIVEFCRESESGDSGKYGKSCRHNFMLARKLLLFSVGIMACRTKMFINKYIYLSNVCKKHISYIKEGKFFMTPILSCLLSLQIAHRMKQLLLFLSSISFIGGTFFVVDTDQGNDQNNGTSLESPFKTIQHCVDTLSEPGDSCNLRKGRYHEEVVPQGKLEGRTVSVKRGCTPNLLTFLRKHFVL